MADYAVFWVSLLGLIAWYVILGVIWIRMELNDRRNPPPWTVRKRR